MSNATTALHDHDDAVAWIVVPVILGFLVYMTMALFIWPYARPMVSPLVILLCIFFPPLFPFLLFFILFSLCSFPRPPVANEIIIVEGRGRPRVVNHLSTAPTTVRVGWGSSKV